MKESKKQIMEGVEATESKIVASNTVEYKRPDGTRVIRLHHTDIIEFTSDDTMTLNSDGWKTVTTKARINSFQNQTTIVQDKGLWYLASNSDPWNKDTWIQYFDGIKIQNGKVLNPKKSPHKKEQFWLKKIQAYCDKLKKMKKLPEPSNGDCWYCLLQTEDEKS